MMRLSSVQIYRQQNSTGQNKIHHVNQTVGCWEVYFFTLYKARPGRIDKSSHLSLGKMAKGGTVSFKSCAN